MQLSMEVALRKLIEFLNLYPLQDYLAISSFSCQFNCVTNPKQKIGRFDLFFLLSYGKDKLVVVSAAAGETKVGFDLFCKLHLKFLKVDTD